MDRRVGSVHSCFVGGPSEGRVFNFRAERLDELAPSAMADFAVGEPFRHFVIDDFVDADVIASINSEFVAVGADRRSWQQFDSDAEVKFALADITRMGPVTSDVLTAFNSHPFVGFLEHVTGMPGIIPDPGFSGGGMHEIKAGGFLKVHADFNRHRHLSLDRRLNVILYLNEDWDDEWGGNLELWNRDMTEASVRLAPRAGRLVGFATDDYSYHGHPDPLRCPENRARRSLALYYYTNGRPAEEVTGSHTTLFKARPGERLPSIYRDPREVARLVRRKARAAVERLRR